ncbi:MAG TPA: hypothetical protein VL523_16860 [Terriglobia bacterium]|nr:hypothetical protein [Terriglobia bacterium]
MKGVESNRRWVVDSLIRGGICMALCYDWAQKCLAGGLELNEDLFAKHGPAWQRRLSYQRAYDFTWFDQGRLLSYQNFFRILGDSTRRWFGQNSVHDGMSVEEALRARNRGPIQARLGGIAKGEAFVLLIAGDEPKGGETGVWGHFVGLAYPAAPRGSAGRRFFDPNQGQFTDQESASSWGSVLTLLALYFQGTSRIRDYVLYQFKAAAATATADSLTDPWWRTLPPPPDWIWDRTYQGLPSQAPAQIIPCGKVSGKMLVRQFELAVQMAQGRIAKYSGLRVFVVGPDASQLAALLNAIASTAAGCTGRGYRLQVTSAIFKAPKPEVRLYYY